MRPDGRATPSTDRRSPDSESLGAPKTGRRAGTMIPFALVGASGVLVNQALLWGLVRFAGVHYLLAAVVATQGSTTWNFLLNELWVFRGRAATGGSLRRFLAFAGVNNATLLVRGPLLALLTSGLGVHYLVSNLITLVLLFASRFLVSDQLIWRAAPKVGGQEVGGEGADGDVVVDLTARIAGRQAAGVASAARDFPYRYDLHGFASVASQVELRELTHFRAESLFGGADIEIRVGGVGAMPRRKIAVVESPGVLSYEEHLGRLGANFRLDIRDRIRVTVAPLLARSPHVVYTNVVEALLRFVLASRDLALLHSATLDIAGRGVMLSARTDTGKTFTILRMLREQGGVFFSDDMSIIASDGRVFAYPKPLTISHHTLRAVDQELHTSLERAALVLRSSIHSKRGRGAGMRLARLNLPIMSINAVTQVLVPPPKYAIERLVPCRIGVSTRVNHLFLIGRGPRSDELVGSAGALQALIENTDDAYGFPPFQSFASAIALGGEDYSALRSRERAILQRMLHGVRAQRMVRDDFSWADDIPRILRAHGSLSAVPDPVCETASAERRCA